MKPLRPQVAWPLVERRKPDYLSLFAALVDEFAHAEVTEAAIRSGLRRIAEAMNAESASLFLLEGKVDAPNARLVCKACIGPSDITGLSLPLNSGIVGRAVQTQSTQRVADTRTDPDFVPPSAAMNYEVRSILCAPMSVRDEPIGAIEVVNPRDRDRLFTEKDREALTTLSSATALAIFSDRLGRDRVQQARLQHELELAAGVQRHLLPARQDSDARVQGLNLPARVVSGDFYDILLLDPDRTAFALADVSGKGMNAALVMVKAATLFRSLGKQIRQPGKLLARIGAEMLETMSAGMFVTMVVGIYDRRRHEVRFANAGHEPPLLRTRQGVFHAYAASDPPLGIVAPAQRGYPETVLKLQGGGFYVFSDGCTESFGANGRMRGAQGLRKLISANVSRPAQERIEAIAAALAPDIRALRDDITLLVVDDGSATAGRKTRETGVLAKQSFAAQPARLQAIRRVTKSAALQVGASDEWADELVLAVDEACQNIIRHGYKGRRNGRIELSIHRMQKALRVELLDFAPPVKQDECKGRKLNELRPGGLGTHFMRTLTDRVQYLRPRGKVGNRLVMTKKIK
ncbi:MAG: SpoIIE family protein phosphatase [Pseudomonadota bacterium]